MTHTLYFFLIMIVLYIVAFVMHARRRHATGRVLVAIGAFLNMSFLIQHATITGIFIWNALVDPVFFIPFVVALLVFLLPDTKDISQRTLAPAFLFLVASTLFAAFYPKGAMVPAANKTGVCPFLFFFFENCSYAFFGLSGILSITSSGDGRSLKMVRRLVVLGFVSFSVAQVVGAMWSFLGWGHPFMWGSRHLSSAAIWLIYAALIHLRFLGSFIISERRLTMATALIAMYIAYSHLIFEMGMPRLGA
jgi:ABC-type transport system involved in cytochrome c biogenesis permease subunit